MLKTLALLCLGASWTGNPGQGVSGTINFSGTVLHTTELAIEDHDMGNGITSYVATYTSNDGREPQVVEVLAYRGDRVDFQVNETLVARRYRHDTFPLSDEFLALMAGR